MEESKKLVDQVEEPVDPDTLSFEQKVVHTHAQRIQELKASAEQTVKDDTAKRERYLNALDKANELLVESEGKVKAEYCARELAIQKLGVEGLKNQARKMAESPEFQKTLAVNVNQELIRNFIVDHNNPKKALDNIFSALNQQAEKEIQKTTQKKKQTKELGSAGGNELNMVKRESK